MHDRGWIVGGLLLFLGLVTFPFWYNLLSGPNGLAPNLQLPPQEKECVAPSSYMRTAHMDLLIQWRDLAVRRNIHTYTGQNGKQYRISLTGTCLQQCHTDKVAFCDRCHAYDGVRDPNCWDCHLAPGTPHPQEPPLTAISPGETHGR
jgi:hypothetical protein